MEYQPAKTEADNELFPDHFRRISQSRDKDAATRLMKKMLSTWRDKIQSGELMNGPVRMPARRAGRAKPSP